MDELNKSIRWLKGIGEQKERLFNRLGVFTVQGFLYYLPFRYEDRSRIKLLAQVQPGEETTINTVVTKTQEIPTRSHKKLLKILVEDGSGRATLVCFNQPYLKDTLPPGTRIFVYGRFEAGKKGLETTNFSYEKFVPGEDELLHTGRIVPIYRVTPGLTVRTIRKLIRQTLNTHLKYVPEVLSKTIMREYALEGVQDAIQQIHFPSRMEDVSNAHRRLAFDEFLLLEVALALEVTRNKRIRKKREYEIHRNLLTPFKQNLPFQFTLAQTRAINRIFERMRFIYPMNVLLQGDVGSGKTVIALSAVLLAIENEYQAVIMCPTEILAEQHYLTIHRIVEKLGIKIDLFIGRQGIRKRREKLENLANGKTSIAVGTHALLEPDIKFHKLAFVVVDEQHKFGVVQKAKLQQKAERPDVLVMTATPIPRTLAMTLYGDLEVVIVNQLPPGRKTVITRFVNDTGAYEFAISELRRGRQVYVVYPLVDDSDKVDLRSATRMARRLEETVFKDWRVGLLHGQLKSEEKETVMQKFLAREFDILISTTVIEVGIDVPNVSTIIIEQCERYGLSTLHQLRGRVGRSEHQSYCFLVGNPGSEDARRRIDTMLKTTDGFRIAEEDLRLRGGGEFFGTKQHGLPEMKIGGVVNDADVLTEARNVGFSIVRSAPDLARPENKDLKWRVWSEYSKKFHLGHVA